MTHIFKSLFIVACAVALSQPADAQAPRRSANLVESYSNTRLEKNREYFEREMGGDNGNPMARLGSVPATSPLVGKINLALGTLQTGRWKHEASGLKQLPFAQGKFVIWSFYTALGANSGSGTGNLFQLAVATEDRPNGGNYVLQGGSRLDIYTHERESPEQFDFAKYQLGVLGRAFGVRTRMLGCGGGGTLCSTQYLTLIVAEPMPRIVMRAPVSSYVNAAGDWHADQTRDHFVEELEAVVVIKKHNARSAPAITVRRREKGRWIQQNFEAQSAEHADNQLVYATRDPPVVEVVD